MVVVGGGNPVDPGIKPGTCCMLAKVSYCFDKSAFPWVIIGYHTPIRLMKSDKNSVDEMCRACSSYLNIMHCALTIMWCQHKALCIMHNLLLCTGYNFYWLGKVNRSMGYSLGKWNVIMYANSHGSLTLVSNKLDQRNFSMLFQWDKKLNCC